MPSLGGQNPTFRDQQLPNCLATMPGHSPAPFDPTSCPSSPPVPSAQAGWHSALLCCLSYSGKPVLATLTPGTVYLGVGRWGPGTGPVAEGGNLLELPRGLGAARPAGGATQPSPFPTVLSELKELPAGPGLHTARRPFWMRSRASCDLPPVCPRSGSLQQARGPKAGSARGVQH